MEDNNKLGIGVLAEIIEINYDNFIYRKGDIFSNCGQILHLTDLKLVTEKMGELFVYQAKDIVGTLLSKRNNRVINILGENSTFIENNKGDIYL